MKSNPRIKHKELINLGLFSISLIPIFLYAYVVYQRLCLPFDLEWGEGAGINQIYRIISGKQLYGSPSIDFSPLVYTPFYYWIAALFTRSAQSITLIARIISIFSSIGAAGIIIWLVIKDTGNKMAGLLASALYLACYANSDGFYDLARVDSLYILLLLTIFLILRRQPKQAGIAAAGLLISVGFFTKQSTLIVFAPLIIYYLGKNWKETWILAAAALLGIIIPFLWVNTISEGWFGYYILRLPSEHGYSLVSAVDFWIGDLLGPLGIAIGFGILFMVFRLSGKTAGTADKEDLSSNKAEIGLLESPNAKAIDYLLFAAGAIGSAWVTRATNGGGANNLMSAYAVVALLFGLGFDFASSLVKRSDGNEEKYRLIIGGMAAVQLIGLIYNPYNFIPTHDEIDANNSLIARIKEVEGPAWIPYRSHLPILVGKDPFVHAVNLFELTGYFKGDVLPAGRDIVKEIQEDICYQSFGMIVLDQKIPWVETQLNTAYRVDDSLVFPDGSRRSAQLSWQGGFDALYIPKDDYDVMGCLESINQGGDGLN